MTDNKINQIKKISICLQKYCSDFPNQLFKPKDVLPYLVEKRVFNKVDSRNGSYLRRIFREVYYIGKLEELIPQVIAEQKGKNIYWYIKAV